MRKHALKWLLCLALVLSMVPAAMAEEVPPHVSADGHEDCIELNTYNDGEFPVEGTILESGTYYLSDELIIAGTQDAAGAFFVVEADTEVTLCLNGYSLMTNFDNTSTTGYTFYGIRVYGTLNLCDCSEEGTGSIIHNSTNTNGGSTVVVSSGGTFNMFGGNICDNLAARYGTVYASAGTFNMYGGKICGNQTGSVKNGGGVAVTDKGTFNMYDGEISENIAANLGGGIYLSTSGSQVNMYGGTIKDNISQGVRTNSNLHYGGGGIAVNGGTLTLYGGTITGNKAESGAGGGISSQGTLTIPEGSTVVISNNRATYGGGIQTYKSGFTMSGGTITGNTATTTSAGVGGGVCVYSSSSTASKATFNGGTISNNTAMSTKTSSYFGGGGIFVTTNSGAVTLDGVTLENNTASGGYGGGIGLAGGTLTVKGDTVFSGNSAVRGGAIYTRVNNTVSAGTFSENTASTYGGGICVHAGTTTVTGGTFSGNIGDDGGAMALIGGVLKYEGGTLTGNEADRGGAIYTARDFRMSKSDCKIEGNTARLGGGIFQGGEASASSNKVRIYAGTISGNTATESGGGLYLTNPGVQATLSDTSKLDGKITISGNTAADGSDGIYNGASSTMLMINGVKVEDASYNVGKFIVNDGTVDSFVTEGDGVLQVLNGKVITGLEGNSELYGGIYPQAYSADYIELENGVFAPLGDGTYALQVGTNFNGSYMELGEKLDMKVCFADASDAFGYYSYDVPSASIVYTEAAPTTAKITYKDGTTKSVELAQGENGLEVSIDGISAKEMADSFRIDLYAGDERVYTQVDSARDYAARILDDEDEAASHQLIADMLAYGAAAQKYFNYNTEDLADSVLANFDVEVSDPAAAITAATPEEDINYAYSRAYHSANLTLENDVDFNLYFWIGQLENTDYTISINGEEQPGVFEECLDATAPDGEPLLYKVKVAGLTYADLVETEVSITFTQKGATQTTTITDSPVNYLVRNDGKARASLNGTDGSALYGSVLAFANSCVAYNG